VALHVSNPIEAFLPAADPSREVFIDMDPVTFIRQGRSGGRIISIEFQGRLAPSVMSRGICTECQTLLAKKADEEKA